MVKKIYGLNFWGRARFTPKSQLLFTEMYFTSQAGY